MARFRMSDKPIEEILVNDGFLSQEQVDRLQRMRRSSWLRINQIAERLEVHRRTVVRYVDALSASRHASRRAARSGSDSARMPAAISPALAAPDAPIAIVLHPHPQFGGTMNNRVVYNLHYAFYNMGFTVLRFNFRGVGRSQGEYDQGIGELSDAASALDYLQSMNNNSKLPAMRFRATMLSVSRSRAL